MNILILGAGHVASTLIQHIVHERADITVIDNDLTQLHKLNKHYDVRTIQGHASYPTVLRKAGAEEADLLIAVTNSDEVNMIACQVAYSIFQIPKKIARIRSPHYSFHQELFGTDALPIDIVVSPEEQVAKNIVALIQYPEIYQYFELSNPDLNILQVKLKQPFKISRQHLAMIAYMRDQKIGIPTKETHLNPGDSVYLLCHRRNNAKMLAQMTEHEAPIKHIMIAGASIIGTKVALLLDDLLEVKIIDPNLDKISYLSQKLERGLVLQGNPKDKDLLKHEYVNQTDLFCAFTDSVEDNLLAGLLAKSLGARTVMAITNTPEYLDLVEQNNIDIPISPHAITAGALLGHIRQASVLTVHPIQQCDAEIIEFLVKHEWGAVALLQHRLDQLILPKATHAIALIRNDTLLFAKESPVVEEGDKILILVLDKSQIPALELLFQVTDDYA